MLLFFLTLKFVIRLQYVEDEREAYKRKMMAAHVGEAEFPQLRSAEKELVLAEGDQW